MYSKFDYSRLKSVREILNINQVDLADDTSLTQRDISQLEMGKKRFLPISYMQYLTVSLIDLNQLFASSFNTRKIRKPGPVPLNIRLLIQNPKLNFDYLRIAREKLQLKQIAAAKATGVSQRDISQLERGEKKFIPLPYLLFLCAKQVDLNEFFNPFSKKNNEKTTQENLFTPQDQPEKALIEPQKTIETAKKPLTQAATIATKTDFLYLIPADKQQLYAKKCDQPDFLQHFSLLQFPGFEKGRVFESADYSMQSAILPKDWIVTTKLSDWKELEVNAIYVWVTSTELLIRRFVNYSVAAHAFMLAADNPLWEASTIPYQDLKEVWKYGAKFTKYIP